MSLLIASKAPTTPRWDYGTVGTNGKYAKMYVNDMLIDAVYEFDTDVSTTIDLSELPKGTYEFGVLQKAQSTDNNVWIGSGYRRTIQTRFTNSTSIDTNAGANVYINNTTSILNGVYAMRNMLILGENFHNIRVDYMQYASSSGDVVFTESYKSSTSIIGLPAGYIIRLRKL